MRRGAHWPRFIGMSGGAGSGKNVTADILVQRYGYFEMALADPIKRIAKDLWGFTVEQLWGPSDQRAGLPPSGEGPICREALQFIGTEIGRYLDPDVWIRRLMADADMVLSGSAYYVRELGMEVAEKHIQPPNGIVVTDVRFPNEAAAIEDQGGQVWLVRRKAAGAPEGGIEGHASEHDMSEHADKIIDNDGTLEELQMKVYDLMGAR